TINRQLADHCAQPAAQGTSAGIIRELSGWPSIVTYFQAVQLSPDRLGEVLSHLFVGTRRACGRSDSRAIPFNQVAPGSLIAALARDGQTQIIGMQRVNECSYRITARVWIVLE